jgi:hypothetical protein
MQVKPVEYAATGSPRAVSSADKLLSATAELQLQQQHKQQHHSVWTSTFPLSLQNKRQHRILSRFTECFVGRTSYIQILPRITQEHKSLALSEAQWQLRCTVPPALILNTSEFCPQWRN